MTANRIGILQYNISLLWVCTQLPIFVTVKIKLIFHGSFLVWRLIDMVWKAEIQKCKKVLIKNGKEGFTSSSSRIIIFVSASPLFRKPKKKVWCFHSLLTYQKGIGTRETNKKYIKSWLNFWKNKLLYIPNFFFLFEGP